MPPEFWDSFDGNAGPLDERVSPSGHVWDDLNQTSTLDGEGRLVRVAGYPYGGSYGKLTLSGAVTSMSMDVSWLGESDAQEDNNPLVMIYSPTDERIGIFPTLTVFMDFVHVVVGNRMLSINYYADAVDINESLNFLYSVADYPDGLLTDGTVYSVSMERTGRILTITGPDESGGSPTIRRAAHPLVATYAGRYIVFQEHDTNAPNLQPRIEYASASSLNTRVAPIPRAVHVAGRGQ